MLNNETPVLEAIKKYSLNLDLLIVLGKNKCSNALARMNLYQGSRSKRKQKRFVVAKIQYEAYNNYLLDLIREKEELVNGISYVLSKYNKTYTEVFVPYFLQNKEITEIATDLNLEEQAVRHIISCVEEDLSLSYKIS